LVGLLHTIMSRTLWLLSLVAVFGCDPMIDSSTVEAALGGTCSNWDCGNAPTLDDDVAVHELDASGAEANDVGARLVDVRSAAGVPLHLIVDGDRVRARRRMPGDSYPGTGPLWTGSLVGMVLTVSLHGELSHLVLDGIATVSSWGPQPRPVTTYRFSHGVVAAPPSLRQPLCKDPTPLDDLWAHFPDHHAVVFRGDRYDRAGKRVIATGAAVGAWFNVGCAGGAVAKLHLMRETEASSTATFRTSPEERQAILKMITADYCGTGQAFTVAGEPVLFSTRRWSRFELPQPHLEAIWTPTGAACLTEARREAEDSEIRAEIDAACAAVNRSLPSCGTAPLVWGNQGYGLTASPL
jgi:hypothetical protein